MKLKPIKGTVKIKRNGTLIAKSDRAFFVLEVGKDIYDPVVYMPADHVFAEMARSDRQTHCPLKGDASYFAIAGADPTEIAWCYQEPFEFASNLAELMAFYADQVAIEFSPL
ncbi:MAG: DUF427 domain-containing protein [Pseudomonadota bacterium]